MRTGPINEQLKSLTEDLKNKGHKDSSKLLLRLANDLRKPTRQRRVVNLSKINRYTKDGETIVVPGKVLATGELDHVVTIAAWQFSEQAIDKIEKSKSKALQISELINDDIKGKRVRIFG
ncbi:50S ribosomal protein L18e [Candidatus Woesearchaeota archaeon]|nr:50S ribosomal protein L18e [Candidatus Woesearchaeota archaeon]|tara:strand:+ start:807 stop:1166 length:360 start_codon:yes stop_codon:yes gene_type:complete